MVLGGAETAQLGSCVRLLGIRGAGFLFVDFAGLDRDRLNDKALERLFEPKRSWEVCKHGPCLWP